MRLQGDPLDKLEQCPIYNSTLEPFISPKYVDSNAFLLTQKVFNSVNFSIDSNIYEISKKLYIYGGKR